MTARQLTNVAASIRQQLLNLARESGRPFNEVLQYFAMERFLYRLSQSPHAEKFVLKGALMFMTWQVPASRSTMDIDLLGRLDNSPENLVAIVRGVCEQPVEPDGLVFDATSVQAEPITEDADYQGVRVRFQGFLGKARVPMQVDVGIGDVVIPAPREIDYPATLDFPRPRLRGYTPESMVAEKFEAMVRFGILNSRMKDFYDIWLLARKFRFDGPTLWEAIRETFTRRHTEMLAKPMAFTEAFATDRVKKTQWRAFVKTGRLENAPAELDEAVRVVADFLLPLAKALAAGEPFKRTWTPSGPWA